MYYTLSTSPRNFGSPLCITRPTTSGLIHTTFLGIECCVQRAPSKLHSTPQILPETRKRYKTYNHSYEGKVLCVVRANYIKLNLYHLSRYLVLYTKRFIQIALWFINSFRNTQKNKTCNDPYEKKVVCAVYGQLQDLIYTTSQDIQYCIQKAPFKLHCDS